MRVTGSTGIFGANDSFVAGFLAIDDVVAWLYAHQELDTPLCAFEVVGGGFPDQLAVFGYEKDVEGRDHGGGVISQAVNAGGAGWDRRADQSGIGVGGPDRSCRGGAQHAAPLLCGEDLRRAL